MNSRKFVLIAFGTLMSAPVWAQSQSGNTRVTTSTDQRRRLALDTIRAMLDRRNPTVNEVLAWSASAKRLTEEFRTSNERVLREKQAGADEMRIRELMGSARGALEEAMLYQRALVEGCPLIRPHQNESEGVLGFQIEKGTEFQRTTPVIKEERFVRNPQIVFVEPNTPAAKADIREGDVWLGIAGRDLIGTYVRDLNEVLKTGSRVDVKVRREGGKEVTLGVVAMKRPDFPAEACDTHVFEYIMPSSLPQKIGVSPMSSGTQLFTMNFRILKNGFAGAMFADLTADKRNALKAPPNEGVYVESITPGSPAEAAGLREFDVVTRVNNEVIESMVDLIKVMQSTGSVSMWVTRPGETGRKVILPTGR